MAERICWKIRRASCSESCWNKMHRISSDRQNSISYLPFLFFGSSRIIPLFQHTPVLWRCHCWCRWTRSAWWYEGDWSGAAPWSPVWLFQRRPGVWSFACSEFWSLLCDQLAHSQQLQRHRKTLRLDWWIKSGRWPHHYREITQRSLSWFELLKLFYKVAVDNTYAWLFQTCHCQGFSRSGNSLFWLVDSFCLLRCLIFEF